MWCLTMVTCWNGGLDILFRSISAQEADAVESQVGPTASKAELQDCPLSRSYG